jgi:hypothetical protein
MSSIAPRSLKCKDSSNELYPHLTPDRWVGPLMDMPHDPNTDTFRGIVLSVLECLLFTDFQYRGQLEECLGTAYDLTPARVTNIYRYSKIHAVLSYRIFSITDIATKGLVFFTHPDQGFRPLFKDYELFLIDRLLEDIGVLKKEYYRTPFLLALQRTCYLWLMKITHMFEMKGSLKIPVRWAHSKKGRDHYDLFTVKVEIEFDMTECYQENDKKHMTNVLDMKIGLPFEFVRSKVDKNQFKDDHSFYDELWNVRIDEIEKMLNEQYHKLLLCEENINDIQ